MSRPTKYAEDTIQRLEEAFSLDAESIARACTYAGIGESTYHDWCNQYPEFKDRMDKARSNSVLVSLAVLRKAAQAGQWQAAAWFLEHAYPEEFGRGPNIEDTEPMTEGATRAEALRADFDRLGVLMRRADVAGAAAIARERRIIGELLSVLEEPKEVSLVDELAKKRAKSGSGRPPSRRRKSG